MLLKLMKHEMKSLWHYCGLVIICVLIASAIFEIGVVGVVAIKNSVVDIIMIPSLIFLGFAIVAVLAYGIQFGVAFRFYRTMSSDEGYLTHTLPVNTSQHILSKLLSACIYTICSVIYLIIFIVLTVIVLAGVTGGFDHFPDIMRELKVAYDEFKSVVNIPIALFIAEYTIMSLVSVVYSILIMYVSVALGQLISTHKFVWSVVFYMIITSVIGIITQIATMIFTAIPGLFAPFMAAGENATPELFMGATHVIILIVTVLMAVVGLVAFFVTKYIYERKLNLE